MVVFPDRIDRPLVGATVAEGLRPLADAPAVVAPLLDDIDLLPEILADVGGPQATGDAVAGELPGVAEAPGVDLRPGRRHVHQRVVGRHGVAAAGVAPVDVDAEDRAEPRARVLAVAQWVALVAAVAKADVKQAVWAEDDRPAVVVVERLLQLEHHLLAGRVGPVGIVAANAESRNLLGSAPVGGRAVADEELAVLAKPGMEGETEQPLFIGHSPGPRAGPQVEEELCNAAATTGHDVDHARLFEDKPAARAVAGMGHQERPQRLGRFPGVGLRRPALPDDIRKCRHRLYRCRAVLGLLGGATCGELTHLDRAEGDKIAVILEAEMPAVRLSERGELRELARGDAGVPVRLPFLELIVADPVDADFARAGHDPQIEMVPLAGWAGRIERGQWA